MARFASIDSQIRANRLILANRFRVAELNPFFANRASGGWKLPIAGLRRFAWIARMLWINIYIYMFFFCESIRANRFTRIALRIAGPSKSSIGLGSGNLIRRGQLLSAPALDRSRSPFVNLSSSHRAQAAKTLICAKKWGFRRFKKERPKVCKNALFIYSAHTRGLVKKRGFTRCL